MTKEQCSSWLENEVTKEFFKEVEERIQEKTEHLVSGGTLGDLSANKTANVVGYITAMSEIISTEFMEDAYGS